MKKSKMVAVAATVVLTVVVSTRVVVGELGKGGEARGTTE